MIFANYHDPVSGGNNWRLMQGIQEGVSECGIQLDIFPLETDIAKNSLMQNAAEAAEQLIIQSRKRPTALITASSNLAYGAYAGFMRHRWSIPQDIALLACGNDTEPFLQLAPDLAYFPVPLQQIGELSAEYCLGLHSMENTRELLFLPLNEGKTLGPGRQRK